MSDGTFFFEDGFHYGWFLILKGIAMVVVLVLIYINLNNLRKLSIIGAETKKYSYNNFFSAQIMIVWMAICLFIFWCSSLGYESNLTTFCARFGFFIFQVYIMWFAWSISSRPREQINLKDLLA